MLTNNTQSQIVNGYMNGIGCRCVRNGMLGVSVEIARLLWGESVTQMRYQFERPVRVWSLCEQVAAYGACHCIFMYNAPDTARLEPLLEGLIYKRRIVDFGQFERRQWHKYKCKYKYKYKCTVQYCKYLRTYCIYVPLSISTSLFHSSLKLITYMTITVEVR